MEKLSRHLPFLIVLMLHLTLSISFSIITPLGEAPDEPAHLSYAQFIAKNGRLPATLNERTGAGYRAAWPPLYHALAAVPVALVGNAPPTRLKAVGDSPRRLIATNGQTIASFIHTEDEAWPWHGITLAWHLGRFISVLLTAAAVTVTYLIARRLTRRRRAATAAAAIHAFVPQLLFTGTVISDDTLLILLSGVLLLTLIIYAQRDTFPGFWQSVLPGLLLGLATVTKYNALPLWAIVFCWLIWLPYQKKQRPILPALFRLFTGVLAGAALTGGWWFLFVWRNFNQIDAQGLVRGSLAALSAGTADASLRQLTSGNSLTLPPLSAWLEWAITLFKSFWGLFGGGGTIPFPTWIYWLLALISGLSLIGFLPALRQKNFKRNTSASIQNQHRPVPGIAKIFLLVPLFFLPLPLLRFILSGSIIETAQGRHLFPALPAIALGLTWLINYQLSIINEQSSDTPPTMPHASHTPALTRQKAGASVTPHASRLTHYSLRITHYSSRITHYSLLIIIFLLSLFALYLIHTAYPPPIPLKTGAALARPEISAEMANGIRLAGFEVGQVKNGRVPVTLVWQATATPAKDYLIRISVRGDNGQDAGGWLGHPIGGRYPTRAWDKGDILRDTIPVPILANASGSELHLTVELLDTTGQALPPPTPLTSVSLPAAGGAPAAARPGQLRADGLPADEPFTYRSTLTFVVPPNAGPTLVSPTGKLFAPEQTHPGADKTIAHFIVGANWPGGDYQLTGISEPVTVSVSNRPRQFEAPPVQYRLDANFADAITILGYDLPRRRVEPGQSFPLTLHLQARRTLGKNLAIFNHLLDRDAAQRGGVDRIPQNYYTTLLWVPGEIVSDEYVVPVDSNAPPGIYRLDAGFYPTDAPAFSLPLFVNGQPIDKNSVAIGPIKVGGPPPGVTTSTPAPQFPLGQPFGDQITLLGYDSPAAGSQPGVVELTLYWQADTIPSADYTVFVHILDAQGNLVAQADSPPAGGIYPTSLWDPGEIIVDKRRLPELPPGKHKIHVGLYRADTGARLPVAESPGDSVQLPASGLSNSQ